MANDLLTGYDTYARDKMLTYRASYLTANDAHIPGMPTVLARQTSSSSKQITTSEKWQCRWTECAVTESDNTGNRTQYVITEVTW